MKIFIEKSLLFVNSGLEIHCFSIDLQAKDKILISKSCFKGHKKPIKAMEIYEEKGVLMTISQDLTLRKWDLYSGNCLEIIELSQEFRIMRKGKAGVFALGSNSGFLKLFKENIEKIQEKQVFKEAITSISFLGELRIVLGSKKGRIKVFDIENMEKIYDIKDINKGSLIYGILPFSYEKDYRFIIILSWGGEIGVWDLKEKKKTASYQHSLKMNNEKHQNSQGSALFYNEKWLFTSGNDDKNIEILEFSIR